MKLLECTVGKSSFEVGKSKPGTYNIAMQQECGKRSCLVLVATFFVVLSLVHDLGYAQSESKTQLPIPGDPETTEFAPTESSSSKFELPEVNVDGGGSSYSGRSFFGKFIEHEISDESIRDQQSNHLSELVDLVPGVDNIGGPRKEAQKISVRGFQPNQVLMLLDGSRQNFQMTHNSIVPVRNHLLKRLDVMKGGASSRFGSGALGGVISFNTMDARDFLSRTEGRGFQARNSYSSNGSVNQFSFTGGQLYGTRDKAGLLLDFTTTNANNVEQVDGNELTFSGYEDRSIWAKNHFEVANGHQFLLTAEEQVKDSMTAFNPQIEVGGSNRVADQEETFRSYRGQYRFDGTARFKPELMVYNTTSEMVRTPIDEDRVDTRTVETNGLNFHSTIDLARGRSDLRWDLQPGVELFRDANAGDRDGSDFGLFPDGRSDNQGYYIQTNLNYQQLWVQAGLRYDAVQLSGSSIGETRNLNETSPELEIGVQLDDNTGLSFSYEEGYTAPQIRQMFPVGLHFPLGPDPITQEPINNNFIPNPNLLPEDSRTVEAKLFFNWDAFQEDEGSLRVSLYRSEVKNYIDQEVNFGTDTTQFLNRESVEMEGLEVELAQEYRNFNLSNTFSKVRAERTFESIPLATAPADQWATILEYRKSRYAYGLQRLQFFTQDRVDPDDTSVFGGTPGFELYNAYVSRRLKISRSLAELRFRVNNLENTFYRRHGSPLLGQSRDFRLELAVSL